MPHTVTGEERYRWRLRAVLQSVASGGAVATVGVAAGRTGTEGDTQGGQQKAIIPEQQQYGPSVTGFFVHIGAAVDPTEASVSDRCDFVDWADDETLADDARLIDRQADPETQSMTLYLDERVDPGTLFIINDREQCECAYLGLYLEQVGINIAQVRSRDFTPNAENQDGGGGGGVGAAGPGMGVLGGLAGLLGGG